MPRKRSSNKKSTLRPPAVAVEIKSKASNSAPNRPRKGGGQRATPSRPLQGGDSLSPCAKDYALSLVDPFDGPLSCVPSAFPPIPSFKSRLWGRGYISIGTAGVGFLAIAPQNVFANTSGIYSSSTAYTQTGFPSTTADPGVVASATNSAWAAGSFGETALGVQYRMVSIGLRVWYIGKEIDIQGEMIAFRQPDNNSVLGLTNTQLLTFDTARAVAVDNNRTTFDLRWIPVKPKELEFNGTFDGVVSMGITVTGLASTANQFRYEVFVIGEYIGPISGRTPSHSDPAGFAAVLETVQQQGDSWYGSARDAASYVLSQSGKALKELSGNKVVQSAARGFGQAVGSYIIGAHVMPNSNPNQQYISGNPGHGSVTISDAEKRRLEVSAKYDGKTPAEIFFDPSINSGQAYWTNNRGGYFPYRPFPDGKGPEGVRGWMTYPDGTIVPDKERE